MKPTIAQLQAEVYQCQLLIQATAERLAILAHAIQQMQAAEALSEEQSLPPQTVAAKSETNILPPQIAAAKIGSNSLPLEVATAKSGAYILPLQVAAAKTGGNSLPPATAAAKIDEKPPTINQLCRVLKEHVFDKTTGAHLRRTAELMLFIRRQAGEPSTLKAYAELLGMGHSGAGKFVMQTRQRGLIKRRAYQVYALTQKGEQYVQEALIPVVLE